MFDLTTVILIGAGLLVLGLAAGLLFGRRLAPDNVKQRETERRLDEVLQQQKAYQQEVQEHFSETAALLNNLTRSYRDVHQHLAKGAATLCEGEGPLALGRLGDEQGDDTEIPPLLADVRPPLDYAPKSSPDEPGMLNESFGIERAPGESATATSRSGAG